MSAETDAEEYPGDKRRKHRHDLGHEDHGAKLAAGTTRTIQAILGLWIALTLVLVVYVMVDASRTKANRPAPAAVERPTNVGRAAPP